MTTSIQGIINYDENRLQKAYEVKEGLLSVRCGAEQYRVPKSTLSDRVTGKVNFYLHSGPTLYLTDSDEAEIVRFISHCAKMGYAKTRKEILAIVEEIISSKGNSATHVSNGWWESFRCRHPELAMRTVEKLSYARSVATDATIINHYFDLLEKALHENEILDSPSNF